MITALTAVAGLMAPIAALAQGAGANAPGPTLAHAPLALQAAVRASLRRSSAPSASEQAELTPSDDVAFDFGSAVAISGPTAVVGAPHCLHVGCPGGAYVFVHAGPVWTEQAKLVASDARNGDEFGRSVAISGTTVLVGAPSKDSFAGAAYVFVGVGGIWSQRARLTASDGAAGDRLGWSVAISGSTALVGAPNKDSITGAAYVFAGSGGWGQQAKLTAADGAGGDYFGWSTALAGSTAVVGAPNRNSTTGAVYVYVRTGPTWTQRAELTASDGVTGDYFGWSASTSGPTIVAGSPLKNSNSGAAYVFGRSGSVWSQQAELTASDASTNDWFGFSVGVSRSIAVVGAFYRAPQHAGAAYVFAGSNGIWSERATLTASDAAAYDDFGYSVGMDRSTALLGAPGHGSTGSAYLFVNL